MTAVATSFYVTGGTLRPDAPSYVPRQADVDLYGGLSRGEFCYILTSRQMGKSSLMARAAYRLREDGVAPVVLDLTAMGTNVMPEQWYQGLLGEVGARLDLEDELEEFWWRHASLAPLRRWMEALRQVALARIRGPIVLFIDEIDIVQSLPFSADEFFAAIRECYNRRTREPEFERLTFCLLGVASPSDLIRDTRMTPFNIGRRIELTDFVADEAAPLARGLERNGQPGTALLQRVLHWTGGQPYLTQRLCQAVSEDGSVTGAEGVDRWCEHLFLSHRARERDDNLLFVRDRLLRAEADVEQLLSLYARVRSPRERVLDDETNPLVSRLRLSGLVREVHGRLQVRNRIYTRVFDREWVQANLPDSELRRLRAVAREEARKRRQAEEREQIARRLLYVANIHRAQQTEEQGDVVRALDLLESLRPEPGQEDLRGFDWRYLWRRCQGDAIATLGGHTNPPTCLAFSPDGRILASGGSDRTVRVWDVAGGQQIATLAGHSNAIGSVAFSPDGRYLASGSADATVRVWDVAARREIGTLLGHTGWVSAVAFSANGRILASASSDGTVRRWEFPSRRETAAFEWEKQTGERFALAFSPDSTRLAVGGGDGPVQLWGVSGGRRAGSLAAETARTHCLAFSPDGRTLASVSDGNPVRLWETATLRKVATLWGRGEWIIAVAFSPDGQALVTGSRNATVKLWRLATSQEVGTSKGHRSYIRSVAFSPDGKTLASASGDKTVKLWDAASTAGVLIVEGRKRWAGATAFSPDGCLLATGSGDGPVTLWEVSSGREVVTLEGHRDTVCRLAFSPDGTMLASGSADATVRLWDVAAVRHEGRSAGMMPEGCGGATAVGEHSGVVRQLVFSADGAILASGSDDGSARLWAVRREGVQLEEVCARGSEGSAGGSMGALTTLQGLTASACSLVFAPDGRILALGSNDGTVQLWDRGAGRVFAVLRGNTGPVWGIAFSPDGRLLVSGSDDGTARLWDLLSQREIAPLEGMIRRGPFLLSLDGRTFAAAWSSTMKLWDLARPRSTRESSGGRAGVVILKGGHGELVREAALSPDGRTLATSSASNVVLWNLAVGQEVVTLVGHPGTVLSIAFSPTGRTLASASIDGTVRLWHAVSIADSDPLRLLVSSGNRVVRLEWQPLPSARGYNVYRGPAECQPGISERAMPSRRQLVKLTPRPVLEPRFTDRTPELVNGRTQMYGVAPVLAGSAESMEGPLVICEATPVDLPPGFMGHSLNEGPSFGSATIEVGSRSRVLILRGSGGDIWDDRDEFFFVSRLVEGNFRITVTVLTGPTAVDPWSQAGLMIRESLDEAARNVCLAIGAANGLHYKWRPIARESTYTPPQRVIPHEQLQVPITLQLTREGQRVRLEYSTDGGESFRAAADPLPFDQPLPRKVHAGLAISAHDPNQVTEATFTDLKIRKL